VRALNPSTLPDRRRTEHLLEKLKEAVTERRNKEEAVSKRTDEASLTSYLVYALSN